MNRSQPLTISWTGGNASDLVEIVGGSSTTSGTGATAVTTSTSFICLTNAGQRTFTVPSVPLLSASGPATGLIVASGVTSTFNAPLKAGGNLDSGIFASFVGTGSNPTYQ